MVRKNTEFDLVNRISQKFSNNEFTYIEGFNRMIDKCRFKCNNCGNDNYYTSPSILLDKNKSIYCNLCNPATLRKNSFMDNVNKNYTVLEKPKNNKQNISVKCNLCDFIFKTRSQYLTAMDKPSKTRNLCPKCNASNSEKIFAKFLDSQNINYEMQKKFKECIGINNRVTPFDFYIDSMNLIVEIDGKQHDSLKYAFHRDIKEYERTVANDNIKNNFCSENNIGLIRLRYNCKSKEIEFMESIIDAKYIPNVKLSINANLIKY
ncbi:hypothetical protein FPHOBKDP_00143 [Listeria phage LPJP1]|nr:hypothetical protein FPHOBKDP_00143 [Listeria phage LPJP1]